MTSQRLEEELECPVCFDRFNIPRVLPCQHTFCDNCLQGLKERGSVRCPECRVVHLVPANGFPINITMQRLLSASEPISNPTVNVSADGPGLNTPVEPSAPPFEPPPPRLPPVYQFSQPHQPIPEQPAQYNLPSRPSGNAPMGPVFLGWQEPSYPPPPPTQPLPRINVNKDSQPNSTSCQSTSCQEPRMRLSQNEEDNDFEQCKTCFIKYFKIIRQGIRKVIGNFLKKYKNLMAITIFLIITFSRFVAGAVKLNSDCPDERRVAEFLFVKSIFGFIFWFMLLLLGCKKQLTNAMDNYFIEVYLVIESLFSLIWLIIGSVWTFGFRSDMIDECPFHVDDWNKHFINFALFLTAVDWIGLVAFGFYCCYVHFDRSVEEQPSF